MNRRRSGHEDSVPATMSGKHTGSVEYFTKPRVAAAITGQTPDGDPITGHYKFNDEFPMADGFHENAEFFTMTYEAPRSIGTQPGLRGNRASALAQGRITRAPDREANEGL